MHLLDELHLGLLAFVEGIFDIAVHGIRIAAAALELVGDAVVRAAQLALLVAVRAVDDCKIQKLIVINITSRLGCTSSY